jgi:fatty-acyl-CoA synthase
MTSADQIKGINDILEIEKIPFSKRVKETSTLETIEKGASVNPEAPAISFLKSGDDYDNPIIITYGELLANIYRTANLLHDIGVGSNDVVTYMLPNLPQTHYVLWGAEAAGIVNPVNPMLEPGAIIDICRAAKTKVLVALGETPKADIWAKVEEVRKEIPSLEHVIRVLGPSAIEDGIIGFEESLLNYSGAGLSFHREVCPDDISSMYHTGGTTGRPKLAKRTHYNEIIMAWILKKMVGFTSRSTLLCGLPLFHCNGTIITGLAPFAIGGNVVLLSASGYRDPSAIKQFYKIVETFRAEFFSAVPTILSMLLDTPVNGADISSLKYAICGAAPLSTELFKRFESHTGIKLLEGYGLTEGCVASALNPKDGQRKIGSIGIRMPYQNLKIVVTDDEGRYLEDARPGEIGTLAIKGPNIFKGYVEEMHNDGIWFPNGYFNTGDLGRMDKDSYFWLTGRKKELIIRGGHNIDPATIEESLYTMKEIKTAAAVGRPDKYAGEVPVAYVQLADDALISEKQILEYARNKIGERAAIPKEIIILDEIPLTTVGKIFKPALRRDAIKRVFENELEKIKKFIHNMEVTVKEHEKLGELAVITVEPPIGVDIEEIRQRINEILSRYTVPFEVRKLK